ncbi:uncharacterized protein F4812DRAFT_462569 [Daldinia caldariorum]|uniref:uncharacterized protein n=1 Tax=Daldinia caldariorum TaxID=326644 RepID=UPI0020087F05|nr:uncharacterized protein F4812DRAFT_462569 [Daldinia caldariorum]KAI1464511.1 hypothetical protein F4812DRAFT_462569 [Daldinia caldariorum]
MTVAKSSDDDDPTDPPPPETSQPASETSKSIPDTDPGKAPTSKASSSSSPVKDGAAPKPKPAAGRPRSATTKPHPTLLGDFLLGRPSPARIAADRQAAKEAAQARRKSLELVKQEMRQAAIMRIQVPGGVHERVKKWQKANAEAMANADPLAPPSEPSEVNIQVDEQSVTEEDRKRIKSGQKKPTTKVVITHRTDGNEPKKSNIEDLKLSNAPKKRVVSDTNWVKDKKKNQSRSQSPKRKSNGGIGLPLPKDFLARPASNPSVSKKVRDWASKVEIPDEPPVRRHSPPRSVRSTGSGDGIRVKPIRSEDDNASGRSEPTRATAKASSSRSLEDREGDGIRVKPIPSENDTTSRISGSYLLGSYLTGSYLSGSSLTGSRVTGSHLTVETSKSGKSSDSQDDGIRVKSVMSESDATTGLSSSISTETPTPRKPQARGGHNVRSRSTKKQAYQDIRARAKARPPPSEPQESDNAPTVRASSRHSSRGSSTRGESPHRDPSPPEHEEVVEKPVSDKRRMSPRRNSKTQSKRQQKHASNPAKKNHADAETVATEEVSDSESWSSDSVSDMPFSTLAQSLAEIPVGYSAFSELDLATGSRRRSARPKTKRQASFKGATNVLKKAITEGKKILAEKVDPPKPVVNRPPNIETWLKDTVDPFVESSMSRPEQKSKADEDLSNENTMQHRLHSKQKNAEVASVSDVSISDEATEPKEIEKSDHNEPSKREVTTPTSAGLKRSRATRLSSAPSKSSMKKGFKEKLIDAFRGESTGHSPPPLEYPSCSEVVDLDREYEDEYSERRRSSGTTKRSPSPEDHESSVSSEPTHPEPLAYNNRKPPTNGFHELSTIISEMESHYGIQSDLSSEMSQRTTTENAGLTRSAAVSRRRSHRSGLKRRLTKHSDLVSALSLPADDSVPNRRISRRSARSIRRPSSHLSDATLDELLLEFEDDEDLYQRELKTLVDGVIPVLLTQFVNNTSRARKDLFGTPPTKYKEDTLDKAVVSMGIALDNLKNLHYQCPPLSDINRLPQWLEAIYPIYNNYLDVWRLGFQGIIVNLAPRSPDDADSLINAMPRNEQGDILNEDGERIDVAHLLKRPLVRVKWITKFIKGYRAISGLKEFGSLVAKWEALQNKARRRHKEENARVIDEDARNSDTSRTRDLRTLEALDNVKIDRFRQVYAKDTFTLDLRHSNGQRLGCQVELIIRDNQTFKSDPGDLLIRETGSAGRSWLLFAPIIGGRFSARRGDDKRELVVMIRGSREDWFELLLLTADSQEQVLEWLDMLGSTPIPPPIEGPAPSIAQSLYPSPNLTAGETPMGERKLRQTSRASSTSTRSKHNSEGEPTTPERMGKATSSPYDTPNSTPKSDDSTSSPEKTPTQDSFSRSKYEDEIYSSEFDSPNTLTSKKSSSNSSPHREDGAPPPPVHRTFSSKKAPVLSPPVDQNTSRLKRRTSSPLKHEYHPSDISSEGSSSPASVSEDGTISEESSDDELEAVDMPDTAPAISIKKHDNIPSESIVSESSVRPASPTLLSQNGLPKSEIRQPEYVIKSVASISYWDNKHGRWQDLWPDLCSIVTTPGLIEAYPYQRAHPSSHNSPQERPLIALDLTPLVMLRNSTVVDLEIRSPVLSYSRLYAKILKVDSSFFRFRVQSVSECESLYMAVHRARMDNAKYKALEEETRVRAFGQYPNPEVEADGSSHRRSWFGRKNSYRASTRAPSQSAGSISQSSGISASSFLRKLMGGGNQSFNIAMSSVDRPHRFSGGDASLYTSSSSGTPPRSPSVSIANSGHTKVDLTTNNLKIRLHLLVSASKWEDHGNCLLEVTRPDRGTRQNLRKYQGMEKRIVVTTIPKKDADKPVVVLDVVLGSQCFSQLGSRGVLINVWEEVKNESGQAGVAPQGGNSGGNVRKWCFQCSSVAQARWIFGLVTQEVVIS